MKKNEKSMPVSKTFADCQVVCIVQDRSVMGIPELQYTINKHFFRSKGEFSHAFLLAKDLFKREPNPLVDVYINLYEGESDGMTVMLDGDIESLSQIPLTPLAVLSLEDFIALEERSESSE